MSDVFFDKFIADLVKGAELNSRANGGPGVNVLISRDNTGHEEKLANHAALGALMGSIAMPGFGAPIGAALGADEGQRGSAAIGSVLGGAGGALAGGGLGVLGGILTGNPELAKLLGAAGAGIGGVSGMMYGASRGGHADTLGEKIRGKFSALEDRYVAGADAAARALGVKVAFLPMLGAIAGPTLARAGLSALGRGVAGKALSGIAGKVAPRIAGGLGGAAFDQAASMAGGALGQKMQQSPQPQGMMG